MLKVAQSGNKKVANSLVAVSTAAVLAVYAAGYAKTRSAANQFEAQSEERRPAGQGGRGSAPANVDARPTPDHERAVETSPGPATREAAVQPVQTAALEPAPAINGASPNEAMPAPAAAPVTNLPAETKAEIVAVPVAAPPPPPPPAPAVAAPVAPIWKDGTYTGWGTSRHGDIQAAVVIEGGRIASATIAQCLTRYSCSVIGRLPPEVAQRQSPEVDYVSGATQSTNAFYYAVIEALKLAK